MTGISPEAIERAEAIDAIMDWSHGLAIGRLAMIWTKSQNKKAPVEIVSGAVILRWGCVEREDGERFLEACCAPAVHFLECLPDGQYRIVGNAKAIAHREKHRAKSSKGGIAKAAKRKTNLVLLPQASSDSATGTSTGMPEALAQALPQPLPEACPGHASANATALPCVVVVREENKYINNKTTTTNAPARATADPNAFTPAALAALWNEHRGLLAKTPKRMNADLEAIAEAAMAEEPDPDYWRRVFIAASKALFLTGQVATEQCPRGFRATLKWVLENHERVAAGEFPSAPEPRQPNCARCWDTGFFKADREGDTDEFACTCDAGLENLRSCERTWAEVFADEGWTLRPWEPETYRRWLERRY